MKKLITLFIATVFLAVLPKLALAQSPSISPAPVEVEIEPTQDFDNQAAIPQDEYFRAQVVSVEDKADEVSGQVIQKVKLRFVSGNEVGKETEVDHGGLFAITDEQKVRVGDTVVMVKTQGPAGDVYYITDKYRTPAMGVIFAIFLGLVVFFGRVKGVRSILGLLLSIFILIQFVIPQVLAGQNPIVVSLIGALGIAVLSLYLAHGVNRRTSVALISTVITLLIAAVLSVLFVNLANLTGTGSEEAIFLRMGPIGAIDLRGLLLGGIIIGALGVLDDITISQSYAIDEIRRANKNLTRNELFKRGIELGREHIASLINTLALAYAGASFPLLLLFSLGGNIPFWLTFNSEFIAEEVIRTLVGSTALILAVPISTYLAATMLGERGATPSVAALVDAPKKATRKPRTTKKTSTRRRRVS